MPARRWPRRAAIAAAVVAVYAALGFLAAPRVLHKVLVERASAALNRDVTVAKVRVNPFALSVTVEELAVKHRTGAPFLAWDSLYVRLAPLRLLAGDVGLARIQLVRPALHVGIGADGALTFQDLLAPAPAAAGAAPAKPAAAKEGGGPIVDIGRLAVEDARVFFVDETRRPAFTTTLGPVTVRLESFRTHGGGDSPYSFAATTDSGETLRWTGTVRTDPLRSAGTLAFDRITLPKYAPYVGDDVLPADLLGGLLDFDTRYELEWGTARRAVRVSGGKLVVDRLALAPHRVAEPPVDVPRIEVTGIEADVLARSARVAEVAVRGPRLRVRREADGTLELLRMAPPPAPAKPKEKAEPWSWAVGRVAIADGAVRLEDLSGPRPVLLTLADLKVALEPVRSAPDAVSQLSASATWGAGGKLSLVGPVRPLGSAGTLELAATDLELAPLAPLLEQSFAVGLAAGRLGAKAKATFDASGAAPRWTFSGDVRLDGLSVTEPGNEELLRWRALEVSGIDAGSTPPRASVRLVRLAEPRTKVYVWEDGRSSLARATRAPAAPAPGGAERPAAPAKGPAWKIALGTIRLESGRATVVDRTVSPPAILNVNRADAKVTKLSTDPAVRSTVDVALEVEGSPVRISGAMDALRHDAYTDLAIASKGVDLTPLDPYGGKFLGYGIRKGKLDLDVKVHVENRNLVGANVVQVNQFTLGDATESKDATKIPVRLALALLQDKDGVILLDVPVEGKLDDPEFRLGKVIWRTILNVLVKVATSPFRALAALAGGGDADLSTAEFVPGTATPEAGSEQRFQLLARSLAQRPALGIELEGSADPERDGAALRRGALEHALRRAKAATMRPAPASLDELALAPEERGRLVKAAYDAAFPAAPAPPRKPGEAAPAEPSGAEMEARLAAKLELPPDALPGLAADRARRAREALVAAGLEPARIFLAEGSGAEKEKGKAPRVYFSVR